MGFPRGLRALNHRDFRRFFAGQLVSQVGTWMQSVAQSWLVLQLTGSPLRLGLIGTLQFAPMLAFSVIAGVIADRLPKKRLIQGTQAVLAIQSLVLGTLAWTGQARYWHVAAMALVYGVANTLDMPARQSFVVEMVGKADVVNAIALNSAAFNAARIVGPAVAGLLIARVGIPPAFFLNSLSFLVVIAALARVGAEGRPVARRGATTVLESIVEGLRYARGTPRIGLVLSLLFVVSLCVFNFSVFVPLLARDVLHQGPQGFGLLMASVGVGAVTGALGLGTFGRHQPPIPVIVAAGVVACGGTLGMGFVRHFWVAVPVLFVIGFSGIIMVASCNTTLQLTAPDELRGRVMGLHTLVFGGAFPVGAFLVGASAEAWGVSVSYLGAGSLGLLGLAAVMLARRVRRR